MDRIRIIVGVQGDRRKLDRLIDECLLDTECSSIVIHKNGSQFSHEGRDYVVDESGNPRCQPEGLATC